MMPQKQHTGSPEPDAQPSAASQHPPSPRAQRGRSLPRRGEARIPGTCAASGPGSAAWKDP